MRIGREERGRGWRGCSGKVVREGRKMGRAKKENGFNYSVHQYYVIIMSL